MPFRVSLRGVIGDLLIRRSFYGLPTMASVIRSGVASIDPEGRDVPHPQTIKQHISSLTAEMRPDAADPPFSSNGLYRKKRAQGVAFNYSLLRSGAIKRPEALKPSAILNDLSVHAGVLGVCGVACSVDSYQLGMVYNPSGDCELNVIGQTRLFNPYLCDSAYDDFDTIMTALLRQPQPIDFIYTGMSKGNATRNKCVVPRAIKFDDGHPYLVSSPLIVHGSASKVRFSFGDNLDISHFARIRQAKLSSCGAKSPRKLENLLIKHPLSANGFHNYRIEYNKNLSNDQVRALDRELGLEQAQGGSGYTRYQVMTTEQMRWLHRHYCQGEHQFHDPSRAFPYITSIAINEAR